MKNINPAEKTWVIVSTPRGVILCEVGADQVLSTIHDTEIFESQDSAERRMGTLSPKWREEVNGKIN